MPGSGLLAALRRKNQAAAETPPPDESKFGARSAAVLAVEQAVAAGATPEASRPAAKGCAISPAGGDFVFDLDEVHPGEEQLELTVRQQTF